MTHAELQRNAMRYAGLAAGPLAWAFNTQLGQSFSYLECSTRLPLLAAISWLLAILSFAAAYFSWYGNTEPVRRRSSTGTDKFVKALSSLNGVLFAFALLLQGISSMVLTGCER
jgi:Mn2+/Fe2+ NRAMP family transporter